jgi:hypothetical protein
VSRLISTLIVKYFKYRRRMSPPSKFRSKIWDPSLIVSQIVSMQFQFYASLLIINYIFTHFVHLAYNRNYNSDSVSEQVVYSLEQIFDHRLVNFHNANNTFICFGFLINSLLRYIKIYMLSTLNANFTLWNLTLQVLYSSGSLLIVRSNA